MPKIAASIILLVGAALLARSLAALVDTDLGVRTDGVMVAQMDLGLGRALTNEKQVEMADALQQRVAAIPTVLAAGFGGGLPPTGEYMRASFTLVNKANTGEVIAPRHRGAGQPRVFLRSSQIPLMRGRSFTDADSARRARPL